MKSWERERELIEEGRKEGRKEGQEEERANTERERLRADTAEKDLQTAQDRIADLERQLAARK